MKLLPKTFSTVLTLFMSSAVAGCVGGDAILWLQGKIVDEQGAPYAECEARILDRNGKIVDERRVQPGARLSPNQIQPQRGANFITEFVFSGYERPAVLTVSCTGSTQIFQRPVGENYGTHDNPIDLGLVTLSRTR